MSRVVSGLLGLVLGALAATAAAVYWLDYQHRSVFALEGVRYHAVLLSNGQAMFGRIEKVSPDAIVLRDVHYVRSQVNAETKEVRNNLIRRGNEIHGPPYTVINRNMVLMVEPVGSESQLGKLMTEQEAAGASR